ncbi:MAG: hypothetical protein ACREFP_19200 [Acetobacteraceae bacterium]
MNAEPASGTGRERLVRQMPQGLKRIEAWLAWFCLGVRPGSVTERERQRNREEFLRAWQELTVFCILFTVTMIVLEAAVARLSAQADLPHPYNHSWLIALPVTGVWGLKVAQVVMNRRRRKIWKDGWR